MNITTDVKMCAEFLGEESDIILGQVVAGCTPFNPHLEEGRHWLVDILRKFDKEQWRRYENIILSEIARNVEVISGNRIQDILTAPSDICFKCVCEVISVNKTPKS